MPSQEVLEAFMNQKNKDVCTQFGHCYCIEFKVSSSRQPDHDQCCMCYHQRPSLRYAEREKAALDDAIRRGSFADVRITGGVT